MTSHETSDGDLLLLIAQRDETAFQEFFGRHGSLVLGVLTKMLRNRAEAEELLQEVFLEAWDRAPRYQADKASGKTWLMMLTRSRALDRLRSSTARSQREVQFSVERVMTTSAPVGTRRLEAAETEQALAKALDDLPTDQRDCVTLSFYRGLSQTQIADELQLPLGTVKYRYLSGMRKLRDLYSHSESERPPITHGH